MQAAVAGATTAAPLADVPTSAVTVAPVGPVAGAVDVVMVTTAAGCVALFCCLQGDLHSRSYSLLGQPRRGNMTVLDAVANSKPKVT